MQLLQVVRNGNKSMLPQITSTQIQLLRDQANLVNEICLVLATTDTAHCSKTAADVLDGFLLTEWSKLNLVIIVLKT